MDKAWEHLSCDVERDVDVGRAVPDKYACNKTRSGVLAICECFGSWLVMGAHDEV